MNDKELITAAFNAMEKAYAPYSGYKVGAALLCKSGKLFTGCNIENASYTPTVCAERTAFFKAVSEGEREFEKIAVVGGKDGNVTDTFMPCGVCRQVMTEFCKADFTVLVAKSADEYCSFTLEQLLPHSFSDKYMKDQV
ncbi:MAG: cytidine deaminase [Clostridia bacterium]|nr:cytidine deaminase [Clostridia bacterium]